MFQFKNAPSKLNDIPGKELFANNSCVHKYVLVNNLIAAYKKQLLKIPDFQRIVNDSAVQEISDKISKDRDWLFIQGNFTCCYIENCEQIVIFLIDGQHRLKAILKLFDDGYNFDQMMINIIFVKCKSKTDIEQIFRDKNKNTPMELHYIDFDNHVIRGIIFQIKNYLLEKYKDAFKKTITKNDSNHLSIDEFIRIFTTDRIKEYLDANNQDVDALIVQIDTANTMAKDQLYEFNKQNIRQLYMKDIDYKRAVEKDFYLPYKQVISSEFIFGEDDVIIEQIQKYKKKQIDAKMRDLLWRHYFTTYDGHCYICNYKITSCSFEAGHIVAEAMGGRTVLGNLRPICKACNNCMKTQNMDTYKNEYDEFMNGLNHDMKLIENNLKIAD